MGELRNLVDSGRAVAAFFTVSDVRGRVDGSRGRR